MHKQAHIGIDLGTTRCVVAACHTQQTPHPLPLGASSPSVPSLIFFAHDGRLLFGPEASEKALQTPERSALLFKRRMGQRGWYLHIDEQEYTAPALSQLLLQHLKTECEGLLTPAGTIVTVPAYFDDGARRDTITAARQAGWQVLGLLNEPTAAALAHAFLSRDSFSHEEHIIVFDLGGGTLDVTLMKTDGEQFQVLASVGDTELGGQDWDDILAWRFARHFQQRYGWDPLDEPGAFEHLRRACQQLREQLTYQTQSHLNFHYEGCRLEEALTREEFEDICRPLFDRCLDVVKSALSEGSCEVSTIERVVLAGGGSRMPLVQQGLSTFFDRTLDQSLDPESAVAIGASLRAARLAHLPESQRRSDADKFLPGHRLQEISAHPLSFLILRDGEPYNRLIFPRHTSLPAEARLRGFTTSRPQQHEVEIYLMQSDAPQPTLDDLLAAYRIEGFPNTTEPIQMELTFRYGENALIALEASDLHNGLPLQVTPLDSHASVAQLLQPPPRDVMLAIDCSASMKGKPILEAKLAALRFLQELRPEGLRLGLISFGDPDTNLRVPLQNDPLLIRAHLSQLHASGTTPLAKAIQLAHQQLSAPRPDAPERERILIVLTDGVPDQPQDAAKAASTFHKDHIRILTVGIGEQVDAHFLRETICSQPSDYRSVTDPVKLSKVFASLASELSGGGTAIAKWNPNPNAETSAETSPQTPQPTQEPPPPTHAPPAPERTRQGPPTTAENAPLANVAPSTTHALPPPPAPPGTDTAQSPNPPVVSQDADADSTPPKEEEAEPLLPQTNPPRLAPIDSSAETHDAAGTQAATQTPQRQAPTEAESE